MVDSRFVSDDLVAFSILWSISPGDMTVTTTTDLLAEAYSKITRVFNHEWPSVCGEAERYKDRRSIDLDIRPNKVWDFTVSRATKSEMDGAYILNINGGRPNGH